MKNIKRFHERTLRRRRVYKGKAVDFWVGTVRLPGGVKAVREYLGHPGAVAVVPVLDSSSNPRILFVRQFRYPIGKATLEIPAGKLSRGESPLSCVKRELEEETGFRAGRVDKVLSFWPTPAFADEIIHVYVARGLTKGRLNPDEDEVIRTEILTLRRALALVKKGRIRDSKTIIGLQSLALRQGRG